MATALDLKLVVKHIANGTFGENLCRVCLAPLTEFCENIFTTVCKEGKEYCIADVLKELCDLQFIASDHYNVCPDCFTAASNAYKFYINTKANDNILHYYVDEMERHLQSIDVPNDIKVESLCVSLPVVTMDRFDYDIKDIYCPKRVLQVPCKEIAPVQKKMQLVEPKITKIKSEKISIKREKKRDDHDDDIVILMNEKGQPSFYRLLPDGTLVQKEYDERCKKAFESIPRPEQPGKRNRRKREPMTTKKCFYCSISYRFVAKLKKHMRIEHGVILFACKICEALTEDIDEYEFHMKTHTNTYECDTCNVTFKKRETMLDHLKEHSEIDNGCLLRADHVCKMCGMIFPDAESLRSHIDVKHYKKYACYFCGRTYKGVVSLEKHVKEHEMYQKREEIFKQQKKPSLSSSEVQQLIAQRSSAGEESRRLTCERCGRGFRGERALLWHARLHNNERPFKCDTCGRAFVSVNRRNQHALCAHSAPGKRCPLCPALFHLRSMVNTHIKKVHLRVHKRRTRTVRASDAARNAAPVPVQELAVALQADILQLQAAREQQDYLFS